MRSARNLYRLHLALAGLGTLAVLGAITTAVGRVDVSTPPINRLLSACHRLALPALSAVDLAVLSGALLGVLTLTRGVRSASRQIRGCRRFLATIEVVGEREICGVRLLVVSGSDIQAFCAGLARPRVYVSTGTLDLVSEAQLMAVVAHEAHHARRRDPLRLLLAAALADGLFFLPALRQMGTRYADLAELAADEAAIASGGADHLAGALLRFDELGGPGVVGIHPERVDHLLGSPPRWKLPLVAVGSALLTLVAVSALVLSAPTMAGGARYSLVQLAAQSCMLAMVFGPILALAGLGILGRRAIVAHR